MSFSTYARDLAQSLPRAISADGLRRPILPQHLGQQASSPQGFRPRPEFP